MSKEKLYYQFSLQNDATILGKDNGLVTWDQIHNLPGNQLPPEVKSSEIEKRSFACYEQGKRSLFVEKPADAPLFPDFDNINFISKLQRSTCYFQDFNETGVTKLADHDDLWGKGLRVKPILEQKVIGKPYSVDNSRIHEIKIRRRADVGQLTTDETVRENRVFLSMIFAGAEIEITPIYEKNVTGFQIGFATQEDCKNSQSLLTDCGLQEKQDFYIEEKSTILFDQRCAIMQVIKDVDKNVMLRQITLASLIVRLTGVQVTYEDIEIEKDRNTLGKEKCCITSKNFQAVCQGLQELSKDLDVYTIDLSPKGVQKCVIEEKDIFTKLTTIYYQGVDGLVGFCKKKQLNINSKNFTIKEEVSFLGERLSHNLYRLAFSQEGQNQDPKEKYNEKRGKEIEAAQALLRRLVFGLREKRITEDRALLEFFQKGNTLKTVGLRFVVVQLEASKQSTHTSSSSSSSASSSASSTSSFSL